MPTAATASFTSAHSKQFMGIGLLAPLRGADRRSQIDDHPAAPAPPPGAPASRFGELPISLASCAAAEPGVLVDSTRERSTLTPPHRCDGPRAPTWLKHIWVVRPQRRPGAPERTLSSPLDSSGGRHCGATATRRVSTPSRSSPDGAPAAQRRERAVAGGRYLRPFAFRNASAIFAAGFWST
jgi:hypothetical protein